MDTRYDIKWSMLMKFGKKDNLLSLQQGTMYMKNLHYYISEEIESDSVGDSFEGQLSLNEARLTLCEPDTQNPKTMITIPILKMGFGLEKFPVFCMYRMDSRNIIRFQEKNDEEIEVEYGFSELQKERLIDFGDSVLIVTNGDEFVRRIQNAAQSKKIGFYRNNVEYYDSNSMEHIQRVMNNNIEAAFGKRPRYSYQQEYRFVFLEEIDDHMVLNIGDISDITKVLDISSVLDMKLSLTFNK